MTAISAASVGVKTMADGTLRITFDIEPNEAGAAFALFGKPGTPAALAALVTGYAAKSDEPKVKPGPRCMDAIGLCNNSEFRQWLTGYDCSPTLAASMVRGLCAVLSRRELDTSPEAWQRFIEHVRTPFIQWQRERATA